MAISIPIISEFDGKGVDKAVQQFKQLEGAGKKAQFAIKKAAIPAAAAMAGLTAILGDSVKAAIEDAAAQDKLAGQLRRSAGATDQTIAAVENFISATSRATATADDDLRPALSKLVTATGEVTLAQDLLNVALDISAATGKDLDSVSQALAKGYAGNTKALGQLSPEIKDAIKNGADFSDVLGILEYNFEGAAEAAANTAEGGMKRLAITIGEAKEALGTAFLPVLEEALPKLQGFADWASENPELLTKVAAGIAGIAGATLILNAAMATNPYVLMAAGVGAVYLAFKKLADWYDKAPGPIKALFAASNIIASTVFQGFGGQFISKVLGDLGLGGGGSAPRRGLPVPAMANGGIVTGPTLALIGEAGPEAVVPLDRAGGMGGVTINVNGGDPEAVVNALRRYMNRYGNIPIRTVAP
jgi:hypothetical protein